MGDLDWSQTCARLTVIAHPIVRWNYEVTSNIFSFPMQIRQTMCRCQWTRPSSGHRKSRVLLLLWRWYSYQNWENNWWSQKNNGSTRGSSAFRMDAQERYEEGIRRKRKGPYRIHNLHFPNHDLFIHQHRKRFCCTTSEKQPNKKCVK